MVGIVVLVGVVGEVGVGRVWVFPCWSVCSICGCCLVCRWMMKRLAFRVVLVASWWVCLALLMQWEVGLPGSNIPVMAVGGV